MGADQNIDWRRAAASTLEWWRDAGVDVLVEDVPFDWLAPDAAPVEAAPSRAPAEGARAAAPVALPASLDAFLAWRAGEAAPEHGWGGKVIPAAGPLDANLMILVDCPERDDHEGVMEGASGRLFDRMLAAIGRSRADTHVACVAWSRPTAGRMPRETADRLGEIARHHVALAGPKRLLVMGDAASRAILSANVIEMRGRLHSLNHKGGKVTEVVASFHPRWLMEHPARKAEAWRDLQMLIGGLS